MFVRGATLCYAQSSCILVMFSRVHLLGHLLFLEFYRFDPIRLSVAPTVRIRFISCTTPILVGLHFVPSTQLCLLFHLVVPSDILVILVLFHSVAFVANVSNSIVGSYHGSQTAVLAFRRSPEPMLEDCRFAHVCPSGEQSARCTKPVPTPNVGVLYWQDSHHAPHAVGAILLAQEDRSVFSAHIRSGMDAVLTDTNPRLYR